MEIKERKSLVVETKEHREKKAGSQEGKETREKRKSHTVDSKDKKGSHSPRKPEHSPKDSEKEKLKELPAPWTLDDFTQEQKDKIKEFREGSAADLIESDENDLQIARWLIARKWDISEATKMFVESKNWRRNEKIDSIFDWVPHIKSFEFLCSYWPVSILPEKQAPRLRTHDGHLVVYERLTEMHPDILDIVPLDDMIKFHLYVQEVVSREQKRLHTEEKSGTYAGVVYVYDLVSLTLSHLSSDNYNMFKIFNGYDANNYPETLRRVFLINSPSVFTMGWKVAKKFLDPVTIQKIVILGSDYQEELFKAIPRDCVPTAYGGTLDFLPSGGGSIKGIKKFT